MQSKVNNEQDEYTGYRLGKGTSHSSDKGKCLIYIENSSNLSHFQNSKFSQKVNRQNKYTFLTRSNICKNVQYLLPVEKCELKLQVKFHLMA